MKQCGEEGNELTHGAKATGDCLDYSIRPSYMVDTDQPPWHQTNEKRKFPPPENAERKGGNGGDYKPLCNEGNGKIPLSNDDLNKAIDWFCQDGIEPKGFGQYSDGFEDYPPRNEPQFYQDDSLTMFLTMAAETINNGGPDPYEDMNWCRYVHTLPFLSTPLTSDRDYDWKLGNENCSMSV
jgi:hypothetical protein